jgi:uroporphyrinogen-III synthase
VLVPRGGKWGDGIAATLRSHGAIPVIAPMINFANPDDTTALSNALHELEDGQFDWLVVTSATTVDVLVSRSVQLPASTRVAAVGETTAAALALAGFAVHFVPEADNSPRGLLKAWPGQVGTAHGVRVLVPQSDVAEPNLVSGMGELGMLARFVSAYRTVGIPVTESVRADVASGRFTAILVSSGSVARQIAAQLAPLPEGIVVACIGPRTAYDARAAGINVDLIAEQRTSESLIDALLEHARRVPSDR